MGLLYLLVVALCVLQCTASHIARHIEDSGEITLENGFTQIVFDKTNGHISSIAADFHGLGNYSASILSKPFALEVESLLNEGFNSSGQHSDRLSVRWLSDTESVQSFTVSNIVDSRSNPFVQETWTITLNRDNRFFQLDIAGKTVRDGKVKYAAHGLYLKTKSVYGLYDRGVAQMMAKNNACLGSNETLNYIYFVGNSFALDIERVDAANGSQTVLLSSGGSGESAYSSGFQDIVIGTYPNLSKKMIESWRQCWLGSTAVDIPVGQSWTRSFSIGANNYDFPLRALPAAAGANNLPFVDLQTYLTGIYASPVGCLQSYFDDQQGTIAPTVSHPDVGYSPDTNFFDPDNFLSLSAMLYSGDSYLIEQVRSVLERTGETMCGIGNNQLKSYCDVPRQRQKHTPMHIPRFHASKIGNTSTASQRTGQLMHHFVSLIPTYESIAGSEQLGPNVFWTWSVLRYVALTQDRAFAQKMFPYIDLSTQFLLTFFDESKDLIYAPGPLWIDVIVRENYTSDSAPIFIPILNLLAEYYDYLDADYEFSSLLRSVSRRIIKGINKNLWSSENDHYFTQLNPDGTSRDFIDYDSNLLMVAFDIAPTDRIAPLLKRVDSGPYTHVRGTWCCEVPYSGDAEDCYIVGGSVCGDSIVTLGRIGWIDALARKRVGDIDTFDNLLLAPLQTDLINDVWLFERYDASGNQIRTSFYFEYPALVTMMLREVRYGIDIGITSVVIDPFRAKAGASFEFRLGGITVLYSQSSVTINLIAGDSQVKQKAVVITGLLPTTDYSLMSGCDQLFSSSASTDSAGKLAFDWTFQQTCELRIVAISSV